MGLLGNIASAAGNNMAQYAHRKQGQDFQKGIEEQRAERAQRLAEWQRKNQVDDMAKTQEFQTGLLGQSREWAVEDRSHRDAREDEMFERSQQAAQSQAEGNARAQVAKNVRENTQALNDRIASVQSDIASIDALSPEEQSFKVEQLSGVLQDLSRQLELEVQTASEYGVTDQAGLRATQLRLEEVQAAIRRAEEAKAAERAARESEQAEIATTRAKQARQLRESATNNLLNRRTVGL